MGKCISKPSNKASHVRKVSIPECPEEPKTASLTVNSTDLPIAFSNPIDRRGTNSRFEAPTAIVSRPEISKPERLKLVRCLNKNSLFKGINDDYKYRLIKRMKMYSLDTAEFVVEKGSPATNFYILYEGQLEVIVDGVRKKVLEEGSCFGEIALLQETTRSASVRTLVPSKLWVIDRGNFESMLDEVTEHNYDGIEQFIKTVPLFSKIEGSHSDSLVRSFRLLHYDKGHVIFKENEDGHLMYIVMSGSVVATKGGVKLRKFTKGEFFGEQALLYHTPRTATLTAAESCKLLGLSRVHLEGLLGKMTKSTLYMNVIRISMQKSETLKRLRESQYETVLRHIVIKNYKANEVVVQEGTTIGSLLVFILNGSVSCEGKTYGIYDVIGDSEMRKQPRHPYKTSIIALEEAITGIVTRERFEKCIGGSLLNQKNDLWLLFNSIPAFSNLPGESLTKMINVRTSQNVSRFEYFEGEHIYIRGEAAEDMYIIEIGEVHITDYENLSIIVGPRDYFGDHALIYNSDRKDSATATTSTVIWAVKRYLMHSILDKSRINLMKNRISLQEMRRLPLTKLAPLQCIHNDDVKTTLVVKVPKTNQVAFLKSWDLSYMERHLGELELIKNTCKLGISIDYPLIAKYVKSYKNVHRVYMLKQFLSGLNLEDYLVEVKRLPEDQVKQYASQILLILEYLHNRCIISRNIASNNFRIVEDGLLCMEDFSNAKQITDRTFTMVGTPHYLSPEVISSLGYSFESDLWSLGVLTYYLVYGGFPFGQGAKTPLEVYESIFNSELKFPRKPTTSKPFRSFVKSLLYSKFDRRLKTIEEVKAHEWLTGTIWVTFTQSNILSYNFEPIFKPPTQQLVESPEATRQITEMIQRQSHGLEAIDWVEGNPV